MVPAAATRRQLLAAAALVATRAQAQPARTRVRLQTDKGAILAGPTGGPALNPEMAGEILNPPVVIVTARRA